MAKPAPTEFTALQKRLHWLVAALLLVQYLAFDAMGRPFHQLMDGAGASYTVVTIGHIAVGVTILALAAWRIALRLSHGAPDAPAEEPAAFRLGAKAGHVGFYVLLFGLPLSGLVAWFGAVPAAAEAHEIATNVLIALAALHIAAALVHQFWWKTGLIRRMT